LATAEVPRVLIVQRMVPKENDVDLNLRMDSILAAAFDEVGQIDPIVWSNTDPVFRRATESGLIPRMLDVPTDHELRGIARKLGCQGVFVFTVVKREGQVWPIANLYRVTSGRPMWQFGELRTGQRYEPVVRVDGKVDEEKTKQLLEQYGDGSLARTSLLIEVNGRPDWNMTAKSLANTWVAILRDGVLSPLEVRPRIEGDLPPQGDDRILPTQPRLEILSDNPQAAIARAEKLESDGDPDLAVLVLQDAIDVAPFDPLPRAKLAELLFRQGAYRHSAEEAIRAARLSPEQNALWLLAAKSYVALRESELAREAVNNALARGIQSSSLYDLLGDVYLLSGDWTRAVESYSRSLGMGPRPKALVGRAIAFALLGRPEEVRSDLGALLDSNPEAVSDVYELAVELLEPMTESIVAELRELPPLLRLQPRYPGHITRAHKANLQALSLAALLEQLPVPNRYSSSHNGRLLAHKLLVQCSSELLDSIQSGSKDALDESVISLSESTRLFPEVRKLYQFERRQSAGS
jgi:tetratricopeptide (TPR) repeat protein